MLECGWLLRISRKPSKDDRAGEASAKSKCANAMARLPLSAADRADQDLIDRVNAILLLHL